MTDFAIIIPDRGDRPKLTTFCLEQVGRMTVKPKATYLVNDEPITQTKDIVWRVKLGIQRAKADGFDYVYIIENDDYYPPDYFEQMDFMGNDFVGTNQTIYYHVGNSRYQLLTHPQRSSLCFTGFRISKMDDFRWPSDDTTFLDIRLWNYTRRIRSAKRLIPHPIGVGIKHNVGMLGGAGHTKPLEHTDPQRDYLRSLVDDKAFKFYESLKR